MQHHIIPLTVDEVGACIGKLKRGKASGFDNISADHIINSHGIVVVQLTCLFNCMIRQGYVPDAFGTGIIIPLVKDTTGNRGSADNYRGITLSPVISKLFELCLLLRLKDSMKTSELQFGLRKMLVVCMLFTPALSNWRPAGRIRPANPSNPARECP